MGRKNDIRGKEKEVVRRASSRLAGLSKVMTDTSKVHTIEEKKVNGFRKIKNCFSVNIDWGGVDC